MWADFDTGTTNKQAADAQADHNNDDGFADWGDAQDAGQPDNDDDAWGDFGDPTEQTAAKEEAEEKDEKVLKYTKEDLLQSSSDEDEGFGDFGAADNQEKEVVKEDKEAVDDWGNDF